MTNHEKEQIQALRLQGYGYLKIGQLLGLSNNAVRSFCRRNGLDGSTPQNIVLCKRCGKPTKTIPKRKPRVFCSDACRTAWWNSHLDCVKKKAVYTFVCAYCGKDFTAYGNRGRKYCSHECYIAHRFGGERDGHE